MSTYNSATLAESVRIGNWYEEEKLLEETGIRYYADPRDRSKSLLTKERCIVHTEQTHPKDYTSTIRETIRPPSLHPEYRRNARQLGPRRSLIESKVRDEIDQEFRAKKEAENAEARKINYCSTSHESFTSTVAHYNRNNEISRVPTRNTNYSTDQAVTYYSHYLRSQQKRVPFPATFVGSVNPFSKSNAFSVDLQKEIYARRTETNERPNPLPTLLEFRTLSDMRNRLIDIAQSSVFGNNTSLNDGSSIRAIIGSIWSDRNETTCSVIELENSFRQHFGPFHFTGEEKQAMSRAFDLNGKGNLNLIDVANFIRRTPVPRRLELIDIYYTKLDPTNEGFIPYSTFEPYFAEFDNIHVQSFKVALNLDNNERDLPCDDFFDYYIDISAEIHEDHEKFENILVSSWGKSC